jgi:hypothetical protein
MLPNCTIISRAISGRKRTSEAMELRVLKRKWGLICRCRASKRASSTSRFCSFSLISMRLAFQIFSGMATTTAGQTQIASFTAKPGSSK